MFVYIVCAFAMYNINPSHGAIIQKLSSDEDKFGMLLPGNESAVEETFDPAAVTAFTTAMLEAGISAGTSLGGAGIGSLMAKSYSVAVGVDVENFCKWTMILEYCTPASGYMNKPAVNVDPGKKEGFASHKTGGTATGSWVYCLYKVNNKHVQIMYSAPYDFNYHTNWLSLAITNKDITLDAHKMYYKYYSFMAREEYYYTIRPTEICQQDMCIKGTMGNSHHPEIHIELYPKNYNDLSSTVMKDLDAVGDKNGKYAEFINNEFHQSLISVEERMDREEKAERKYLLEIQENEKMRKENMAFRNSLIESTSKSELEPFTIAMIGAGISAGASLTGTTVSGIMASAYSIAVAGSVENFCKWIMIFDHCKPESGYMNVPMTNVGPGKEEGFASHKTGGTATGSWVYCLFHVNGKRVHIMYSAPYDFNYHSNWMSLAITSNAVHLDAHKMYYYNYQYMVREEYYYKMKPAEICQQGLCIKGSMGTSHKPEIKIELFPQSFDDISPSVQQITEGEGDPNGRYAAFIKQEFNL